MRPLLAVLLLVAAGCHVGRTPLAPEADPGAVETPEAAWEVTPDLQVSALAPGVWLHVSWHVLDSGVRYPSNGLLVREGDGLLLIDTAWGEASTAALLDWTEAELGLSVTRAFSTHWHADRLGGAPVLAARGIPFYAHPLTREAAAANGLPLPTAIADLASGETAAFGSAEVLYPGPGHTVDNTMVWLREHEILVGGCAVKDLATDGLGYTGDADVEAWPRAIERAQEAYPQARIVVPGHGPLGGTDLLRHTHALLAR